MKKNVWLCLAVVSAGFFSSSEVYACIGSKCKPCPIGFSVTQKCCKNSDMQDCVILRDEIEDCGAGKWKEYSHPLPIATKDYCCKDATENYCRSSGGEERYCGSGDTEEFPYSPVKKCCKDTAGTDCVIIRAKGQCGKYQLEDYPVREADCCNLLLKKCTGQVKDCPRCI